MCISDIFQAIVTGDSFASVLIFQSKILPWNSRTRCAVFLMSLMNLILRPEVSAGYGLSLVWPLGFTAVWTWKILISICVSSDYKYFCPYLHNIFSPSSTLGVSPGNGPGDPSGADGPWGHLPPYLLLAAAGRKRAGQLRWAQVHWGPAGRLPAQSGWRWDLEAPSHVFMLCGGKEEK